LMVGFIKHDQSY